MINNKKITVIMPAYNAGMTLEETFNNIPKEFVDDIILVDDCSKDNTIEIAKKLNIKTFIHDKNSGYGANQKTCYDEALKSNADIIIMLHPDGQYDPKLIPAIATLLAYGEYDFVIASRFLGNDAKHSSMPRYKYYANRFLTIFENLLTGASLSEYHSGYRAYSRKVLEKIPFNAMSNNFVFDNEMLSLIIFNKFKIAQIPTPTRYNTNASSINFINSCIYGLGVLRVSVQHFLARLKIKTRLYG